MIPKTGWTADINTSCSHINAVQLLLQTDGIRVVMIRVALLPWKYRQRDRDRDVGKFRASEIN